MEGTGAGGPGDTDVLGPRIGAFVIDALLATVICVILGFALADRTDYAGAQRNHDCSVKEDGAGELRLYCSGFQYHDGVTDQEGTYYILDAAPAAALAVVVGAAVYVVAPFVLGASIGKLILRLRVVRADGSRAGPGSHILRWLVMLVDLPLTLGICAVLTVVFTPGHRRAGDLAAGTYVVRKPSAPPGGGA